MIRYVTCAFILMCTPGSGLAEDSASGTNSEYISYSDQVLKNGGFSKAEWPHVPVENVGAVKHSGSWLDDAGPDWVFAHEEIGPVTMHESLLAAFNKTPIYAYYRWSYNRTASVDSAFIHNMNMSKFDTYLDDLNNDERSYIIGNALSAEHAKELRLEINQNRYDASLFGRSWLPWSMLALFWYFVVGVAAAVALGTRRRIREEARKALLKKIPADISGSHL